jgi:NAD(P)-dependent dehydrogenase (short-subunit alcohol dehydrogenase family)
MSTRSVVVTGCGAGIGRAIFERLLKSGWFVVGVEIDPTRAEEARVAAGECGDVLQGDVADTATLEAAADRSVEFAPLRGWVNNAGITWNNNLHDPDPQIIERVFEVDLFAVFWGCSTAIKRFLTESTGGSIVNISSIHGTAAFPDHAAYDTAKGGVNALTRYISVEYGPVGVRANAIAPGAILTASLSRFISRSANPDAEMKSLADLHPLRRIGKPEEVAAVAEFLLSDAASFVSGQVLAVDGGATARCFNYPPNPEFVNKIRSLGETKIGNSESLNSSGIPSSHARIPPACHGNKRDDQ